jgi:hypothetical protein
MASPALVELQADRQDELGRVLESARYSTREMVGIEREMAASAERMEGLRDYGVASGHVAAAMERQDAALRRAGRAGLNAEQLVAIGHVTGPERIASVVGLAGTGKSTLLTAARDAWETQGYRVHGAALSGKAAAGLEESAGIASRTLASWERGWERGFDQLAARDIFVIDEAGMIGSKQLAKFVTAADRAGAKIVLVGDPEQLQPIGAGAAFRAISERVGFAGLEEVVRQREAWQREASVAFGRYRTAEGLAAYHRHGAIRFEATAEDARGAIVRDVMADMDARPGGSRLVLAHRRVDAQNLNESIRGVRRARGELAEEYRFETTEGERAFAVGDRVLFRENSQQLGVKNGMLGTVEQVHGAGAVTAGHLLIRLDSSEGPGQGRTVSVSMADYAAVDHGYATTIHKGQGATVDRAYVLASSMMDRHMTYVSMTRHRDGAQLYAGRDEFSDLAALTARLSRSQAKETTLDYEQAGYARRRGISMESEIILPEPVRDIFDGLALNTAPLSAPAPAPEPDALAAAIAEFLLASRDNRQMTATGLPLLPHQQLAIELAHQKIDALRPGFGDDLVVASQRQPKVAGWAEQSADGMAAFIAAGERIGVEREEAARRQAELAELAPVRERLLKERMEAWWRETYPYNRSWERSDYMRNEAKPVEAALKQEIETMPAAELRRIEAGWAQEDRIRKAAPAPTPAPRRSGPSPF